MISGQVSMLLVTAAHPGHGGEPATSILHYLAESIHAVPMAGLAGGVVLAFAILARRRRLSR